MIEKDPYSRPVPEILLAVGLFLLAESVTFTVLAPRSQGHYKVDFLDFGFVLAGAILVTVIGILEGRRLRSRPALLWSSGLAGVAAGICGGFVAIWFSGFGR